MMEYFAYTLASIFSVYWQVAQRKMQVHWILSGRLLSKANLSLVMLFAYAFEGQ